MISHDEELPCNYHATTMCYYHVFLSYIIGSIYNMVVLVVKSPHVRVIFSIDIFFMNIPLMIVDYYHVFTFHLREYRKKLHGSYMVVNFHDFYFPYGIGQNYMVVKHGSKFSKHGSFFKQGGEIS